MSSRNDEPYAASPAVTRQDLVSDLRALGIRQGQTLLVHASMRSIGRVDGGARAVVDALREAVGPDGNLVVPAGTQENSNTSRAHRARIAGMSPEQITRYRMRMPAFDRNTTPATGMGPVAEAARTTPGAVRSAHPQSSFAALGPLAETLMDGHLLSCHLGEDSPLAKLYELGASILLLGVGYQVCSAMHLAEYRYAENPPMRTYACVVSTNGRRHWTAYRDVVLDDHEFDVIGEYIDKQIAGCQGCVGYAKCRLMPLRTVVDFATKWMREHRR